MQEPQPTIRVSRIHCYDERDGTPDPPTWLMSFRTDAELEPHPATAHDEDTGGGRTPEPPHRQAM
ncbi:hypothetical protein HNQ07_002418 [Deinococcus metalli]|uniref:Uncharacterized protein n=1 Tax=Deinococcus metalli TaxID=1141878 RepID=A0A7W8NNJ1_9DEIO|nr:hypothetical protein [Deinococcus metalli]MBB5376954.1 hypothetical protein [Deinococcus metalli]GHF46575.1 hypothetical protein GCM10017781_23810 [Deinococcus metalli]